MAVASGDTLHDIVMDIWYSHESSVSQELHDLLKRGLARAARKDTDELFQGVLADQDTCNREELLACLFEALGHKLSPQVADAVKKRLRCYGGYRTTRGGVPSSYHNADADDAVRTLAGLWTKLVNVAGPQGLPDSRDPRFLGCARRLIQKAGEPDVLRRMLGDVLAAPDLPKPHVLEAYLLDVLRGVAEGGIFCACSKLIIRTLRQLAKKGRRLDVVLPQ